MAKEKEDDKVKKEKVHITIDEIDNGFEVSCYTEKKKTLSQRAGWVPECSSYSSTKKLAFKTMNEVLAHLKKEQGEAEPKK